MTEIKNFIPKYPNPDDPNFSQEVARLREFSDLRLKPIEKIPDYPGTPLSNQELQARYFAKHTPYAQGILWHGLGTGKCIHPDALMRLTSASSALKTCGTIIHPRTIYVSMVKVGGLTHKNR